MSLADEYERRCREVSDIHEHLPTLFQHVIDAASRGPVVVELGTRTGNSTAAFLRALQVRQGGVLHSVDIATPEVPEQWWSDPRWVFHPCDSISDRAVNEIVPADTDGEPFIDVLFIDTSHTYDQTTAELTIWQQWVKPGGVVLLHDTEVKTDVCQVAAALDRYCKAEGLTWTNDPRCYGLGTIRVPQ